MPVHVDDDLCKTGGYEVRAEDCCGCDEGKEIAVVSAPYAVVEPDAVVVLGFDTVVTDSAMMASGWSPEVACFAVFGRHFHCCCG